MSTSTRPPSAKPLFKTISGGGRSKYSQASAMFGDLPDQAKPLPEHERRAEDFYPTGQPEAIRSLFGYDGPRIRDSGSVWEPACGDGALVREIRAMGMACIASDLIDRGCPGSTIADFYSATRSPARAIITNPPFCEISSKGGGRWLRHTLAMLGWDYLALLLSWDWPAGRINGLWAAARRTAMQLVLPDEVEAGLHRRGQPCAAQWLVRLGQTRSARADAPKTIWRFQDDGSD